MCCSTVLNETELNSICLDEEQAEIMTGGFTLSGCPTPQQRHQATPHIRVAFTLNHTVALQELAWQKVTRSCQEPAGCRPSCWGMFCPSCFSRSTFSSFCAGSEGQCPLDLQPTCSKKDLSTPTQSCTF